jgi:hypothetical protein
MRPFAYWAWRIAWIWLGSFILVGGGFIIAFFMPFSPYYRSLDSVEALKVFEEILSIYFPYLGIIFGAYAYSRRHNVWHIVLVESHYPKLIMWLSLFFNFFIFAVLLGHVLDVQSDLQRFIDFVRLLNTGFAFFVAWYLTYFFDHGAGNPAPPPNANEP